MLVLRGYRKVREDHHEHEDVVDRKRLLDHIAGEELKRHTPCRCVRVKARYRHQTRVLWKLPQRVLIKNKIEEQRETDPHDGPRGCLTKRDGVCFPVKDAEIDGEEYQYETDETSVEPPVF